MKTISQTFITETRPDAEQYTKAVEVFWHTPLAKLLSGKFDLGRNQSGIGFTAGFRVINDDLQLVMTPERRGKKDESGEAFTHLRSMRWLSRAWRARRATGEAKRLLVEDPNLLAA